MFHRLLRVVNSLILMCPLIYMGNFIKGDLIPTFPSSTGTMADALWAEMQADVEKDKVWLQHVCGQCQ